MADSSDVLDRFIKKAEHSYNLVFNRFNQIARRKRASPITGFPGQAFAATVSDPRFHKNSVEVRGHIWIKQMPYSREGSKTPSSPQQTKHAAGPSGFDVVFHSLDIYKFLGDEPAIDESFLYKSNVSLNYYQRSDGKYRPLHCVRYDFDKSYDSHPIFHAQFESGLHAEESKNIFDGLPEIKDPLRCHAGIRIPTANVIGATALVCLAADHLPICDFPNLVQAVRQQEMFNDSWRCNMDSMDEPLPQDKVAAHKWYSAKPAS